MSLISNAYAEAPAQQAAAPGFEMLIMIGLFFVIMYFMIIRPQQKRQKEHKRLMDSLSKGDEVVTNGGIMGRIKNVSDDALRVEIADGVEIKMQKHAIATVLPKGTLKQD